MKLLSALKELKSRVLTDMAEHGQFYRALAKKEQEWRKNFLNQFSRVQPRNVKWPNPRKIPGEGIMKLLNSSILACFSGSSLTKLTCVSVSSTQNNPLVVRLPLTSLAGRNCTLLYLKPCVNIWSHLWWYESFTRKSQKPTHHVSFFLFNIRFLGAKNCHWF